MTLRVIQLRRSFSVDFLNDDSATVFLHEDNNPPPLLDLSPNRGSNPFKPPLVNFPTSGPTSNGGSMATAANMTHWQDSVDIDDALAADFDGSLSGLGMELGTSSFNMSEAIMALPSLKSEHHFNGHHNSHHHSPVHTHHSTSNHKESLSEHTSSSSSGVNNHSNSQEDGRPVAIVHGKKNRLASGHDEDSVSIAIKRFCVSNERDSAHDLSSRYVFSSHESSSLGKDSEPECCHEECANEFRCQHRHSNSAPDLRTTVSVLPHSNSSSPSPSSTPTSLLTQILSVHSQYPAPTTTPPHDSLSPHLNLRNSNQFQYVLGAATSMATKAHEETMTYLNQGQSYEIKLKRMGDLSEMRGKKLRSIIRVGFHERRLQYMEKDLIMQWKQQRQSERILDVDIPLSYGIVDTGHDPYDINKCEFSWDPMKETGLFVKVNCISTEFTPKKHGGEKGVPFRLIIETHSYTTSSKPSINTCLHAASCQVKVFKPKGADRKHKTDREKMGKRPQSEQDKFQPSYDCTVFTEYPLDSLYWSSTASSPSTPTSVAAAAVSPSSSGAKERKPRSVAYVDIERTEKAIEAEKPKPKESAPTPPAVAPAPVLSSPALSSEADASETALWLQKNRFGNYVTTFSNFSSADVLRLSREDLIQICGLTDGIRLFNALHSRLIRPRLTLYVCIPADEVFRAIFLENLTVSELASKLGSLILGPAGGSVRRICTCGPSGIMVLITDEVVQNMAEESMFIVELDKDSSSEVTYSAILKPYK